MLRKEKHQESLSSTLGVEEVACRRLAVLSLLGDSDLPPVTGEWRAGDHGQTTSDSLPEKKYLFVLLATKHCQLKFEDLLVYSFFTYRAGTKHPAVTLRRIADNLGFCRPTVRQSLRG